MLSFGRCRWISIARVGTFHFPFSFARVTWPTKRRSHDSLSVGHMTSVAPPGESNWCGELTSGATETNKVWRTKFGGKNHRFVLCLPPVVGLTLDCTGIKPLKCPAWTCNDVLSLYQSRLQSPVHTSHSDSRRRRIAIGLELQSMEAGNYFHQCSSFPQYILQ